MFNPTTKQQQTNHRVEDPSFRGVLPHLFTTTSMALPIKNLLKSVYHVGDAPQMVAPPDDLHDEIHESDFCEDSEQFSDEDDNYETGGFFTV